jgi:hypothetical protein
LEKAFATLTSLQHQSKQINTVAFLVRALFVLENSPNNKRPPLYAKGGHAVVVICPLAFGSPAIHQSCEPVALRHQVALILPYQAEQHIPELMCIGKGKRLQADVAESQNPSLTCQE